MNGIIGRSRGMHDMGKIKKPEPTDEQIVREVLEENDFDAERVLVVLVETLVNRHVDCELRKYGRRDAWTPGNERINSLTAALDALHQAKFILEDQIKAAPPGGPPPGAAERGEVLRTIMQLLATSQFAAERRANLIDEDGEEKPIMRLVTD